MKKITAVTIATSLGAGQTVNAIDAIESNAEEFNYEDKNKTVEKEDLVEALKSLNGIVTATSLNVRSTPDTDNSPIGKLYKNDTVTIISQENNGWYKINYNGQVGYVSNDYIEVENNVTPDYRTTCTSKTGKVVGLSAGDTLNVRSLPNTSGTILSKLSLNTTVKITGEESNGWYRIEYNSQEGFVSGKYIEVVNCDVIETTKKGKVINVKSNDVLNVRESNSPSSKLLYTLKNGTEVDILEKLSNGWIKISYNGKVGYVNGRYIEEIKEITTPEQTPEVTTGKYEVTSDINLRTSASWSGNIIRVAKKGEILDVISVDGEWAKINLNGIEAYAPTKYLIPIHSVDTDETESTPESPKPETKTYIATADINFRDSNSWSGNIVHVAKKGEIVNVISIDGDWAKVYHVDTELYAPAQYLVEEDKYEEAPAIPEVPSIPDNPNMPEETPVEKPDTLEYITTADINLRVSASWSGDIIKVIKSGEIVDVVEVGPEWTKIYYDNQYGYIPSRYIIPKDLNTGEITGNIKYTEYNFTISQYIAEQRKSNTSYSTSEFEKYINPINGHKYEFLELNKFREISVDRLNALLSKNNAGVLVGQGQAIYNAAKKLNLDPLYLVAQSIHETGYGKSTLAKGVTITEIADENSPITDSKGNITGYKMIKLDTPVTVYNLYGIGAKDNLPTMPNRALILGTTYAYNKGWTSVEKAIEGAAEFISTNYVNSTKFNQNTLYKIRFNPNQTYLWHQYATTPWYARDIAKLMEKFDSIYESDVEFSYDVPKFNDSKTIKAVAVSNSIEDDSFISRIGKEDIVNEKPWME